MPRRFRDELIVTKVYACITICALFLGYHAFAARSTVDLQCSPPASLFDGGYAVTARQTSDKTYNLQITEIQGWRDDIVQFSGPSYLIAENVGASCRYKFVDDINEPKTVVSIHPHVGDVLETLKGTKLSQTIHGEEQNLSNRLDCVVSQRLINDLPPCQK